MNRHFVRLALIASTVLGGCVLDPYADGGEAGDPDDGKADRWGDDGSGGSDPCGPGTISGSQMMGQPDCGMLMADMGPAYSGRTGLSVVPQRYPSPYHRMFVDYVGDDTLEHVVHGDSWCYDPTANLVHIRPRARSSASVRPRSRPGDLVPDNSRVVFGYGYACTSSEPVAYEPYGHQACDYQVEGEQPGANFRLCGDCGWQFCLADGSWSTECDPYLECGVEEECGPGGRCVPLETY